MGQEVVLWVKKRCLGVFWAECEVADLKQRGTAAMDHRSKIRLLVLPTDDPGDAPDYITEYCPCTVAVALIFHWRGHFPLAIQ